MTTTAEILQKARDLISDEKNWTQGDYARIGRRGVLPAADDHLPADADCFCAVGSICRVAGMTIREAEASAAWDFLNAEAEFGELHEFNDSHTHAEVLDLFDRAIKRAISAEEAA
jgi:hypothetical protein